MHRIHGESASVGVVLAYWISYMVWLKRAHESVSKETIQNCWRVTGLLGNTDGDKESDQIGKELQQLQA